MRIPHGVPDHGPIKGQGDVPFIEILLILAALSIRSKGMCLSLIEQLILTKIKKKVVWLKSDLWPHISHIPQALLERTD